MPSARKIAPRAEDRGHFMEMAETWEMLLKHQQEKLGHQQEQLKQQEELKQEVSRLQTIALADRFRNVLFLSDVAAKQPAKEDSNERAA
jgi:hypothetical protein